MPRQGGRAGELPAPRRDHAVSGPLRGDALLAAIAQQPPGKRDLFVEELLGIAHRRTEAAPLGGDAVGYIPSGVASILRMLRDVPVGPQDVVVDLGCGLGKVLFLTELLVGARGIGVDVQPHLVREATDRANALGLTRVRFQHGDAASAPLQEATVIFMYLPFTGMTLERVLAHVGEAAARRPLVVCTLGFDLPSRPWLRRVPPDSFWLTLHHAGPPGVAPRLPVQARLHGPAVRRIVEEEP